MAEWTERVVSTLVHSGYAVGSNPALSTDIIVLIYCGQYWTFYIIAHNEFINGAATRKTCVVEEKHGHGREGRPCRDNRVPHTFDPWSGRRLRVVDINGSESCHRWHVIGWVEAACGRWLEGARQAGMVERSKSSDYEWK